jgi:diguanylate cyclase (GGDEF)-like protein
VAYAGALLRSEDGSKLGTLCVTDTVERSFDAAQIEVLNGLARQVMNLVALRAAKRELTQSLAAMTELARTDALTGLLNRAAWHEEAHAVQRLVQRQAGTLTLVMLDLDHFKRINDGQGHAAGDAVLREVGRLLRTELRATDRVGRIGGEEFAIAMPFTTAQAAASRIDRLRSQNASHTIMQGGQAIAVTVSAGLAEGRDGERGIEATLRRADAALYRAKDSGRNRIVLDEPLRQPSMPSRPSPRSAPLQAA